MAKLSSSLDSNKHNRNSRKRRRRRRSRWAPGQFCGQLSAVGPIQYEGREVTGYVRIYCKSWRCPYCGPKKAAAMCRRIGTLAKDHGLSRFVTLTLDPAKLGSRDGGRHLRKVWAKCRVYLKRKYGKPVQFISVVEETKAGVPHLHLLIDQYVPQDWLSSTWDRLGGGRIVHIKQVHDLDKCGFYLGKYLTKEMLTEGVPLLRRITTSRGIRLREPGEKGAWEMLYVPLEEMRRRAVDGEGDELDEHGRLKFFAVDWTFGAPAEDGHETVH